MKHISKQLIFILLLFFGVNVVSLCCAARSDVGEKQSKIVGVWKMVSNKPLRPDGSVEKTEFDWQMMKIITKSHFMFAEQAPDRKKFTQGGTDQELCEAAKSFYGGAGTYTYDEKKTYIEHIEIFLNPTFVDVTVKYEVEFVSDDLWTQKGVLPAKALGLGDEDIEIFEVWQRVE